MGLVSGIGCASKLIFFKGFFVRCEFGKTDAEDDVPDKLQVKKKMKEFAL